MYMLNSFIHLKSLCKSFIVPWLHSPLTIKCRKKVVYFSLSFGHLQFTMQTKRNVFVLLFHVFFFATYIIYDCVSVAGYFFNSDFFEGKRIGSPSTRCALNALKAVLKRCFSARNTHMEHTPHTHTHTQEQKHDSNLYPLHRSRTYCMPNKKGTM